MPMVRTRIAPSPTGNLHVGVARAALFNYLFARQQGGQFLLRIEDTDTARSKPEFEETILAGLRWLGLHWDEKIIRQSERTSAYHEAVQRLLASDAAYQQAESEAVYLRVAPQEITFEDTIRGSVHLHTNTWGGDFVIARSPEDPVFHLAVVVDDAAAEITHVIRGEDHLTNTARHILLQRALGHRTPQYAHLPLLLDFQRRKLSKRNNEVSLLAYRQAGFLPEAMVNYLALLGWNPGDDREIFSLRELVEHFSLARVQKSGAIFSLHKLQSMNQHYLRGKSPAQLRDVAQASATQVLGEPLVVSEAALMTEQTRVVTLRDLIDATSFAREDWAGEYPSVLLAYRKSTPAATAGLLEKLIEKVSVVPEIDFTAPALEATLLAWIDAENLGHGDTLWPMRVALTGREHSPGPFEVAAVLGKQETERRLAAAHAKLRAA